MSTSIDRNKIAPPETSESSSQLAAVTQAVAGQPPDSQMLRLAFSVRETATILGISEKSVRRLISRGLLRPSKALRHLLIPKNRIESFLDQT